MNQIQKLEQIEYSDYYSVFDKNGNKICDTGTLEDAILMCTFESSRTYKKIKIIMDHVVNVPFSRMEDDKQLPSQNILPERQQEPFLV